jgi:peptidoglycan hydrolase-like protein with peptidoglycan-binding domain
MAKKIIRLTEKDLTNIVKRVIKEQNQMSGEEVFELQNAINDYFELKKNSKRIPTDGKWGPATIEALKMFQKAEGINPDGIAGPETYNKLHSLGLDQDAIDSIISGLKKVGSWIAKKFVG